MSAPRLRLVHPLALIVFLAATTGALAQVESISWESAAIRSDRTDPVRLELRVAPSAGITAVRIDYTGGGALDLTSEAGGTFVALVPASRALDGYGADDVNRNHVGSVRLIGASGVVGTLNLFINVIDGRIAQVPVTRRSETARETPRILNLHRPVRANDFAEEVRQAVRELYTHHPDVFDFVQVVFSLPSYVGNRYHIGAQNRVEGIGLAIHDQTRDYGSAGHLLGVNVYPLDGFFDCGETAFSHETGHQWVNHLDHPRLAANAPHWPPSSMATGIMGYSSRGGAGGDFWYRIEADGPGTARLQFQPNVLKTFSDFDLYLMGLVPASAVRAGVLLDAEACHACTVPVTPFTIDELIAMHGPRVPSAGASQTAFRVATIVVTRERLLTDEELAFFEYFAARGEAREPLPFSAGLAKGMTNPFHLATRGLATVDLRLEVLDESGPRRRAVRK